MSTITAATIKEALNHPLFKTPTPPQFKFLENKNLTIPGPVDIIARTWKQRLFTLPWKPFKTHLHLQTYIPDPNYYVLLDSTIVAHPDTMVKLKRALLESSTKGIEQTSPLSVFNYDPYYNLRQKGWGEG